MRVILVMLLFGCGERCCLVVFFFVDTQDVHAASRPHAHALSVPAALGSLPAPVNLSIRSVNFNHTLRWDPGAGTPPGTRYRVYDGR